MNDIMRNKIGVLAVILALFTGLGAAQTSDTGPTLNTEYNLFQQDGPLYGYDGAIASQNEGTAVYISDAGLTSEDDTVFWYEGEELVQSDTTIGYADPAIAMSSQYVAVSTERTKSTASSPYSQDDFKGAVSVYDRQEGADEVVRQRIAEGYDHEETAGVAAVNNNIFVFYQSTNSSEPHRLVKINTQRYDATGNQIAADDYSQETTISNNVGDDYKWSLHKRGNQLAIYQANLNNGQRNIQLYNQDLSQAETHTIDYSGTNFDLPIGTDWDIENNLVADAHGDSNIAVYDTQTQEIIMEKSVQSGEDVEDIEIIEPYVYTYEQSQITAHNMYTGKSFNVRNTQSSGVLNSEGTSILYSMEDIVIKARTDSTGEGTFNAAVTFLFQDVLGMSQQNAGFAAGFVLTMGAAIILGSVSGGAGVGLGGLLGTVISSITGLWPLEIVFVMIVLSGIVVAKAVTGGGQDGGAM